ncbi:MAG: TIGR00180 family glycosyltransferase [Acidobacteria bacterium]|nr:TIGR00180 family glycosyltransferase [Acidobacteriota bacterium]
MPDALNADTRLTILLMLRDRVPFTVRWMAYANRVRLPFKVFIADGGSDDSAGRALGDHSRFPHVDYTYVRYPHDATYADFYAKLADALSRIDTPYVALADNDDFLIADGVRQAIRFLADHPEYATCGGQCAVFWVTPSEAGGSGSETLYGRRVEWKTSLDTRSVTDATARARLEHQSLRATTPIYYHVQRTSDVRRYVDAVMVWNPADLFLLEHVLYSLAAIAGRTKQLDTLYIARQWNSPETIGGGHIDAFGDWLGRMLAPTWSEDFAGAVRILSAALADRDHLSLEEARAAVVAAFRMQAAPPLLSDLLKDPHVDVPMSAAVWLVQRLLARPSTSAARRLLRRVYRRMPWISVDAVHGTEFRTRAVAGAAEDFGPMREFLREPPAAALDGR